MKYDDLLNELLALIQGYGTVHRKTVQPFIKDKVIRQFPEYNHHYNHEVIRESLLEHVGCLPVIAAFLHPHMDREVDLGRALTMISIHDIGELIVGDELTFTKSEEEGASEVNAAMELLHENYVPLYTEINELKTNDALFVKSIDKLAPDLYDFVCGARYSIERLSTQTGWHPEQVISNIREKKRPYMEWSPFLTALHDELFSRFESDNISSEATTM